MVERLHDSAALAAPFAPSGQAAARARESSPPAVAPRSAEVFDLVYRQMRTLAGHREVDELAQIAAEQALRSLPRFEGRSALATWTFRICYLTVRKHDRWYRRWLRRFSLTDDGRLPDVAAEAPGADDRLARDEQVARIRGALAQISARQRAVVVLHDLEGLDLDAVAAVVGAGVPAVRSRLRDGRKALARILALDPYFGVEACGGEEERR
jgi:RNA polymerase sigma-70 factor (ECF subfamily)